MVRDRRGNLLEAVERVRRLGEVVAVSSFYDTAPVGYVDQPRFLNGALLLRRNWSRLSCCRSSWRSSEAWGGSARRVRDPG